MHIYSVTQPLPHSSNLYNFKETVSSLGQEVYESLHCSLLVSGFRAKGLFNYELNIHPLSWM